VSKPRKAKESVTAPVAEPAVKAEQKLVSDGKEQAKPQGKADLTPNDEQMFTAYENTIRDKISGFASVGMALKAIKDQQLHKIEFPDWTFEQYCRERWGLSDKYAYRLIDAHTCVDNLLKELSPIGETRFPTHESQVRALTALKPAKQVKAWKQVLKDNAGKPITADEVEKVVNKLAGKPAKETTAKSTPLKKAEQKLVKIGELVTEALEADDSKLTVSELKKVLEKIQKMIEAKK